MSSDSQSHALDAASPQSVSLPCGLESLAAIMPELFVVIEQPSYDVEYLNPAGRSLLGIENQDTLAGRSLMEFVPNQCLWTLLNDAVPTAWRVGFWSGNIELRRLDGKELAMGAHVIARPASTTPNGRECLWLIAHDVTAMQQSITTLKRDRWYLKVLLENSPDYIYFKDLDSRFIRVSHAMANGFKLADPKMMEGKCDSDFFTQEHAQPAYNSEQEIIRTGRPLIDLEERETWADGRVTWVSTTKLPLYNEYGQVVGTFGISRDVTGRKHAEMALAQAQRKLLEASRLAGMAEVASGVLHNIGNAFNSVNTSTGLIADQAHKLKVPNFVRAIGLMKEHTADLAEFLTNDPRGKQLPAYLDQLATQMTREHQALIAEITSLAKSVDHIKNIIAMQQSYARASSFVEELSVAELVAEALEISEASLSRHQVAVAKDFDEVPRVKAARHKVLEILVNLIGNAKYAMDESKRPDKTLTISIKSAPKNRVRVSVKDNGIGIPAENLQRIFSFGFTTKPQGHGFGLHSSALAAQEMDGSLLATSEGRGKGAEFALELPVATPAAKP